MIDGLFKKKNEKIWKEILKQHCSEEDGEYLSILEKIFYTFKALTCYLLGREKNIEDLDNPLICVFGYSTGFNGEFTTQDWTELRVGKGLLNWHIYYNYNGCP
jgi:hypothetical protein